MAFLKSRAAIPKGRLWAAGLAIALAAGASATVAVMYPQHLVYVIIATVILDLVAVVAFMMESK